MNLAKKFLLLGLITVFAFLSCQKNEEASKTGSNSDNEAPGMNIRGVDSPTVEDISEAYALLMADNVNHWGLEIDIEVFKQAFLRCVGKDIPEDEIQTAEFIYGYAVNEANERRIAKLKNESDTFMAENAKKPGIQTLESGLQIEVLKPGTGVTPQENWTCRLHYIGTFVNGKEFDNSREMQGSEPVTFDLATVIPAWQEGLTHMQVGGSYKLYVPYNLAYGAEGISTERAEIIPPYSALIFEIELIDAVAINPGKEPPKN